MRTHVLFGLCLVAALAVSVGCGGGAEKAAPGTGDNATRAGAAGTAAIAQKLCPVMGDPINPDIYVDYRGRRIYFCCAMCPPRFNAEPERYLKVVDDEIKGATPPAAGHERPGH